MPIQTVTHEHYEINMPLQRPRSGSIYTERERDRERGFSSWNSIVICRKPVQVECEREQFFVRANDRLDCRQRSFVKS